MAGLVLAIEWPRRPRRRLSWNKNDEHNETAKTDSHKEEHKTLTADSIGIDMTGDWKIDTVVPEHRVVPLKEVQTRQEAKKYDHTKHGK